MFMDKFIDPQATVTPFIAGIAVMFITATCWSAFGLPCIPISLILSLAFGLLSVREIKATLLYKFIYVVINTLIVFSSAYGDTLIIKNIGDRRETMGYYNSDTSIKRRDFFVDWFNPGYSL